MPRAKSDSAKSPAVLDAEAEELQKKLADKRKAARAARNREKAQAAQARAIEEAEFNRDFVEAAKSISLRDYAADGRTVYEMIRALIRPTESPEPDDIPGGTEEHPVPGPGPYHLQPGLPTA